MAGRIVAIADAYDVMTSSRSYKKPLSPELARQELTSCAGTLTAGEPLVIRLSATFDDGPLTFTVNPPSHGTVDGASDPWFDEASNEWRALTTYVSDPGYLGDDQFDFTACESPAVCDVGKVHLLVIAAPPVSTTSTFTTTPPPTTVPETTVAPTTLPPAPTAVTTEPRRAAPTTNTTPPNAQPRAIADEASVAEDTSTLIDVLGNDSDPEAATLRIAGIGTPLHGSATIEAEQIRYTPYANFNGSDQFTYTVSDGTTTAVAAVVSVTVTPVNDAPTAGVSYATASETSPIGTVVVQVIANDVDGDPLTYAILGGNAAERFAIDASGTVRLQAPLNHEATATYALTYAVSDGTTTTLSIGTIGVLDTDEPPSAGDDAAGAIEDTVATFDLSANDVDPEGGALVWTIPATSAAGATLTAIDGVITYTPLPHVSGPDSFTYTVTDPGGQVSAPATVTIVVAAVNDRPVAVGDNGVGFNTNEDTPFTTADVTLNDSDVEDATLAPAGIDVVTLPTNGSLSPNGDGTFDYTPDPDWFGIDSFTYALFDSGSLRSNTVTVTIVVSAVNDAPRATDNTLSVVLGGSATTVDVRLNDIDPEGGALTIASVTNGANGVVTNNGDGTLTYVHDGTPATTDSFSYVVQDPEGAQTTALVGVSVTMPEDNDGVPFAVDNCPTVFNPGQFDTDDDGTGDECDASPTDSSSFFRATTLQNLGTEQSFDVAAGDLNGDGNIDLVFANDNAGNSVWFRNPGAGSSTFANSGQSLDSAATSSVALADLDGDGDLDIVFSNTGGSGNSVWLNNGSGVFAKTAQSLGTFDAQHVSVGDLDSDGDLDLVFANKDRGADVWLNNGSAFFTKTAQTLGASKGSGTGLADIDGDGDLDLLITNDGDVSTIWRNNGGGTFTATGQVLPSGQTHDVAFADLDADGDLDFVIAGDQDGDSIWRNDGTGTFTKTAQTIGNGHSRGVAVGDMNGDGAIDVVFGDHVGADQIWQNNGSGTFSLANSSLSSPIKSEGITLADVNGDGVLDVIAAADGDANTVRIAL